MKVVGLRLGWSEHESHKIASSAIRTIWTHSRQGTGLSITYQVDGSPSFDISSRSLKAALRFR